MGKENAKPARGADRLHLPLILAFCALLASPAAPGRNLSYVCENGDLSRSVEVVSEPGYACRVRYTKYSTATYPWNARNEADYCAPKALGLVDRLRSWGWECDSAEDVESILRAHIERYQRHIRILNNVGKTCHFYPGEVQFGDLCGDRREEGAVVYSCDTGTDEWEQHLAVFIEIESEPLILEVGGSNSRQVTAYHFENRRLTMETQAFADAGSGEAPPSSTARVSIQCLPGDPGNWRLEEL